MNTPRERILVVESDPDISDVVARQSLMPMGYQVQVVGGATAAIQEALRFNPDVVIINLNLPGLSGKDLLVALSSQGLDVPIVVIAAKGLEGDVIQAFRLGAADFLSWPARETEVLTVVERALKQVRSRREREILSRQLNQTNQELQRRVRELTTIFAMGKAVTSITDLRSLFDKIIEGGVYVVEANAGWLLIRDDRNKTFLLSAHRNLPSQFAAKLGQPWDDGLSSLVAMSGESLSIHGDALRRFKVSQLGKAALVVPVKVGSEVVGLMVVVRKEAKPFNPSSQTLLEAVADYASIALVNARLFRALEERAHLAQQTAEGALIGERIMDDLLCQASQTLQDSLTVVSSNMDMLLGNKVGKLSDPQGNVMMVIKERIKVLQDLAESLKKFQHVEDTQRKGPVNLNDLTRQSIGRFQSLAQQNQVGLFAEFSSASVIVHGSASQLSHVIDGLLTNAIRFSKAGGQVTLKLVISPENQAHYQVQVQEIYLENKQLAQIFEKKPEDLGLFSQRFAGLGVGLPLVKDIVTTHGGRVWVESEPSSGSVFHFILPAIK